MPRLFPEERRNDEALLAFVVKNLEKDNGARLKLLFGLSDRDIVMLDKRLRLQWDYQDIGDQWGLSRESIRQALLVAYGRLRRPECRYLWDIDYARILSSMGPLESIPLEGHLLNASIIGTLSRMGVWHFSDLIGKTRAFFIKGNMSYFAVKELERELAEYGLAFRSLKGRKKDAVIS